MRLVGATLAVVCGVLLSACGSTVDVGGLRDLQTADEFGHALHQRGAEPVGSEGGGGVPGAGPSTGTARTSAAMPAGDGLATGPQKRGAAFQGAQPRALTGPAKVGFIVITDVNAAVATIGYRVDTGDNEKQARAAAAWLNTRGGLAGRHIVPEFYRTTSAAVLQNSNSVQQAACTHFTEDTKVGAVVAYLPNMPLFEDCLTARGILVIRSFLDGRGADTFTRAGDALLQPAGLETARSIAALADALGAQRYWRGHRIGWFLPDGIETTAAMGSDIVRKAFERNGIIVSRDFRYSSTDIQQAFRDGNAAVLQFKAANLDRVILTGFGGTTYFMNPAASQGYYPGYALGSDVDPSASTITVTDSQQLSAVTGVGWQPATDVGFSHISDKSQSQRDCANAMMSAGQEMSADTAALEAMFICDGLFFLRYGAIRTGGSLVPKVFAAAVATVSQAYDSPVTQLTDTTRRDGAAAYQIFRYDAPTNAFRYTSPARRIRR